MRRRLALPLLAPLLWACPRPPLPAPLPAPAPPPPPAVVPEGCAADLSGEWEHAKDPSYRYQAEDDGGSLSLELSRAPDAGVTILLARTPRGFVGTTRGIAFTSTGHSCLVAFPTELRSCADGGLVLASAASTSVNDACQAPQGGPPPAMREQRLVRVPPRVPPDAGTALSQDAGDALPDGGDPDEA